MRDNMATTTTWTPLCQILKGNGRQYNNPLYNFKQEW